MPASTIWNRKPLPQNQYAPLPLTAIRPLGKLRERVEACAALSLPDRLAQACLLHDTARMDALQGELRRLMDGERMPGPLEVRALMDYHAAASDKQAPLFLLRYARDLRDALRDGRTLPAGQAANLGDVTHMALWLYNLTGQKVLLEFCRLLKAQAPDWMSTFQIFPHTKAITDAPPESADAYWRVHGPTIASALKVPAMQALFEGGLKNETAFAVGWEKLTRYHGAAHGLFSADPLLAGGNPSRELDAETILETMHSMRVLLWALGTPLAGDVLERAAYGPAAVGGSQSANQLLPSVAVGGNPLTFASSLWMATRDEGLAAAAYAPSVAQWRAGGHPVRIETETEYPYGEQIHFHVQTRVAVTFPLYLRIPQWAEDATLQIDGEDPIPCPAGGFFRHERPWHNNTVTLTLPMQALAVSRFHQSISVERGPLTYALPVSESTGWNIALLPSRGYETAMDGGVPILDAWGVPLPDWKASGSVPAAPPVRPAADPANAVRVTLRPYGETSARIAQFPVGE